MYWERIKEDNWYNEWQLKDNNGDVLVTIGWTRKYISYWKNGSFHMEKRKVYGVYNNQPLSFLFWRGSKEMVNIHCMKKYVENKIIQWFKENGEVKQNVL